MANISLKSRGFLAKGYLTTRQHIELPAGLVFVVKMVFRARKIYEERAVGFDRIFWPIELELRKYVHALKDSRGAGRTHCSSITDEKELL